MKFLLTIFAVLAFAFGAQAQTIVLGNTTNDTIKASVFGQKNNSTNTIQGLNTNRGTNDWHEDLIPDTFVTQAELDAATNAVVAGTVTQAQLVNASNVLAAAFLANDVTTSNALITAILTASNNVTTSYLAADVTTSNALVTAIANSSNILATAYKAADVIVSNTLVIALANATNILGQALLEADLLKVDNLNGNVTNLTNWGTVNQTNGATTTNLYLMPAGGALRPQFYFGGERFWRLNITSNQHSLTGPNSVNFAMNGGVANAIISAPGGIILNGLVNATDGVDASWNNINNGFRLFSLDGGFYGGDNENELLMLSNSSGGLVWRVNFDGSVTNYRPTTFNSTVTVPTPSAGTDAANKTYVDSVAGGGGSAFAMTSTNTVTVTNGFDQFNVVYTNNSKLGLLIVNLREEINGSNPNAEYWVVVGNSSVITNKFFFSDTELITSGATSSDSFSALIEPDATWYVSNVLNLGIGESFTAVIQNFKP